MESKDANSKNNDGSEPVSQSLMSDKSSPPQLGWPVRKAANPLSHSIDSKMKKPTTVVSESEMMKERFAKLLLGEDMSGSGKGVCPALAISNAITNLCATVFGQLWRLEPLKLEMKTMWQREMEWLLSVSHYIVEFTPSWQTFPDGSKLEVMTSRPRSDLFINLPALRKLDNILLEILDAFTDTEFWYVDQGVIAPETDGVRKAIQRQEDKWWLPVPRVPPEGLSEDSRKQLSGKRECASQILKAAISINTVALAEMEVPPSYLETLPKSGRACLGEVVYRFITSEHFSAEYLLDCLDLSSELLALELVNRVEAAIHLWRKRQHPRDSAAKSSWEIVKDLMTDGDKRELLAERADRLLHCLKLRFPALTQTTLDATKIQCNKDIGKSILESYSRVLESLASNIVARIDDLLYVDNINTESVKFPSVSLVSHKNATPFPFPVPVSSTTPTGRLVSPAPSRTPLSSSKPPRRGLGVKRVLTNYLGGEARVKSCGNIFESFGSISNRITEEKEEHVES